MHNNPIITWTLLTLMTDLSLQIKSIVNAPARTVEKKKMNMNSKFN
jgi:hypothetical protein